MYVYVCESIYIYLYIHIYMCIYNDTRTHKHTYIYIYIYIHIYIYVYTYILYVYIHVFLAYTSLPPKDVVSSSYGDDSDYAQPWMDAARKQNKKDLHLLDLLQYQNASQKNVSQSLRDRSDSRHPDEPGHFALRFMVASLRPNTTWYECVCA